MTGATYASPMVAAIERAWSAIQAVNPEVPDVVVTMQSGLSRFGMKLGHFAPDAWGESRPKVSLIKGVPTTPARVHELFVGGEGLARGGRDVFGTLLHEAVHAACEAQGIQDTSRQGRYHNRNFRDVGESYGLKLDKHNVIGWSLTTLPDDTAAQYADAIAALEEAITVTRGSFRFAKSGPNDPDKGKDSDGSNPSSMLTAECSCDVPRKLRMGKRAFAQGSITCDECNTPFNSIS